MPVKIPTLADKLEALLHSQRTAQGDMNVARYELAGLFLEEFCAMHREVSRIGRKLDELERVMTATKE